MPFIGLTGGIGSGKSTALQSLERLGAAVLSTDQVVHDLYDHSEIAEAVAARFGPGVAPGGVVDRGAVARIAFADAGRREWLERLLWPRVGEAIARWRAGLEAAPSPPRAAVVEVPLLFESGMEDVFDATVVVVADEQLRSERAQGRGHEAVTERAARQLTQEEKAQRGTYVVVNDGTVSALEYKLSSILAMLEP
jgi:dephospho-CoA kinase